MTGKLDDPYFSGDDPARDWLVEQIRKSGGDDKAVEQYFAEAGMLLDATGKGNEVSFSEMYDSFQAGIEQIDGMLVYQSADRSHTTSGYRPDDNEDDDDGEPGAAKRAEHGNADVNRQVLKSVVLGLQAHGYTLDQMVDIAIAQEGKRKVPSGRSLPFLDMASLVRWLYGSPKPRPGMTYVSTADRREWFCDKLARFYEPP